MTVPVTVNATWRLSRVEFNTRHNTPWDVRGMGEVLLQEAEGGPGAAILGHGFESDGKKTYGAMPSASVTRLLDDETMNDTIEVDGKVIHFASVVACLNAFMEKWRVEDEQKPPVAPPQPQAAPETEMPPPRTVPDAEHPVPPKVEMQFKG